jgi:hypothetical protein
MGCICAKNTSEEGQTKVLNAKKTASSVILIGADGGSTMYASKDEDLVQVDPSLRLVVKVVTMRAESTTLQVKSGTTIKELRRSVLQTAAFLTGDFWLVWKGKVLEDHKLLFQYGVSGDIELTAISIKPKVLRDNPFIKQEMMEEPQLGKPNLGYKGFIMAHLRKFVPSIDPKPQEAPLMPQEPSLKSTPQVPFLISNPTEPALKSTVQVLSLKPDEPTEQSSNSSPQQSSLMSA